MHIIIEFVLVIIILLLLIIILRRKSEKTNITKIEEELRLYADQISNAYEEERKRIARDLHDETIQNLIAISRRLDNFISSCSNINRETLKPLEYIHESIDDSLKMIRHFIYDLRPPTLEYLGLVPAVRDLIKNINESSVIKIGLKIDGFNKKYPQKKALIIYRIIQEAVNNIWRHSFASEAEVLFKGLNNKSEIIITDNGKGFETDAEQPFLKVGKLGIMGMKERAHLIGGKLKIESEIGNGTIITLKIV
jgi:two-component system, NarL family, sensor histidine kinase DegS